MKRLLFLACLMLSLSRGGDVAHAQYLGEIRLVGYPECPRDWIAADGRLLNIRLTVQGLPDTFQDPLFTVFGTSFGGDGKSTFALPDLSGKAPAPSLTWCVARGGVIPKQK